MKKIEKAQKSNLVRVGISGVLLFITLLVYLMAKHCPAIMFPWYQRFSRRLLWAWANLTDLFPFSLMEWGFVGLGWLALGWIIRIAQNRKGLLKLLTSGLWIASILLNLFVCLWGADQFAPTFVSRTPYAKTEFTVEEAAEAAAFYLYMANGYGELVPRDEQGLADFGPFQDQQAGLESGFSWMTETYGTQFDVGHVTPKPMAFSYLMSLSGLTGIYTAYTGEMGINVDTPDQSLPYVMCHECAHRTTVTQEHDANFVAFLACTHSEDLRYQYSGYYSAFIYVYNAIAKVDKGIQKQLWGALSDKVKADILAANEHYAQFERPVQRVAQRANDHYLRSFNQPNGIDNYGAVAGPLIAYYWETIAEK